MSETTPIVVPVLSVRLCFARLRETKYTWNTRLEPATKGNFLSGNGSRDVCRVYNSAAY